MTVAWVIGSGGLLGSALVSELSSQQIELFLAPAKFDWNDGNVIFEQLNTAVKEFSRRVAGNNWQIYWAAGNGSMSSSESELKSESKILEELINYLLVDSNLSLSNGIFAFSSSAGAVYAGSQVNIITEKTPPKPINAYGHHKILQEDIVSKLNKNGEGASIWNFRISTLYGTMQKKGKRQGLLSEIARRSLRNQVIHVYVPLQTMRDYIDVKVAAKIMVNAVTEINLKNGIALKIIASEVSTSIAQILTFYKKIFKRNLRFVTSSTQQSADYSRVISFRSISFQNSFLRLGSSLMVGITNIVASERQAIADQKVQKIEK